MIPFEPIYLPTNLQNELGETPTVESILELFREVNELDESVLYRFDFPTYSDEARLQLQCPPCKYRSVNDLYNIFVTILGPQFSLKEFLTTYFTNEYVDNTRLVPYYCGDMGRIRFIGKRYNGDITQGVNEARAGLHNLGELGSPSWNEVLSECYRETDFIKIFNTNFKF